MLLVLVWLPRENLDELPRGVMFGFDSLGVANERFAKAFRVYLNHEWMARSRAKAEVPFSSPSLFCTAVCPRAVFVLRLCNSSGTLFSCLGQGLAYTSNRLQETSGRSKFSVSEAYFSKYID